MEEVKAIKSVYFNTRRMWMYNFLMEKYEQDPQAWWSPTEVGRKYGESKGISGMHSSTASPVLIALAQEGWIERNIKRGKYRFKPQEV